MTLLLALSVASVSAQQSDDGQIVEAYFNAVHDSLFSRNELIVKAALCLLNTPYVAQTLEHNAEEALVINLRELDCMTLVENCLALSKTAQQPQPDYADFARQLQNIRYRDGIIDGYPSRLHYTTDWITNNVSKGNLQDITAALGGQRYQAHVGFMSAHPESYPSLKENPQATEAMRSIENAINQRTTYTYIPKNEIAKKQSHIKSGDIICFVTNIAGLDIAHVAIAYWENEQLTFIHASTQYHKVIINPISLVDYCEAIKTDTGIMVLRAEK
ncbi:xylanase [Bacteroidia bacterium]|nr:xylanase [Bacteroidia bacterium]